MSRKKIYFFSAITLSILMIPLITMQFSDEVNWGLFDFLLGGVLIFGAIAIGSFIFYKINKMFYRIAALIILVIVFILTWAELAVGLFNSPVAGN